MQSSRVTICAAMSLTFVACSQVEEPVDIGNGVDDSVAQGGSVAAPPSPPAQDDPDPLIDEVPLPAAPTAEPDDKVCAGILSTAEPQKRPMDVIVVIDASGSMTEEIHSVEQNINEKLALTLEAEGVDYQVVMISPYTLDKDFFGVCVSDPLGPSPCEGRAPDASPHAERFLHYPQIVTSRDALCVILDRIAGPPDGPAAAWPELQNGWASALRADAFKSFILVSDDMTTCLQTTGSQLNLTPPSSNRFQPVPLEEAQDIAGRFEAELQRLSPEHFGSTPETRNYEVHSFVGITGADNDTEIYEPTDPYITQSCPTAEEFGGSYQSLSMLTSGLRYPVCSFESYDTIFTRIADKVVEGAKLPCSWALPEPTPGEPFDADKVNIVHTAEGGTPNELGSVDTLEDCVADAWYYDDPAEPTRLLACPETCTVLESGAGAVEVKFGCPTVNIKPPDVK